MYTIHVRTEANKLRNSQATTYGQPAEGHR